MSGNPGISTSSYLSSSFLPDGFSTIPLVTEIFLMSHQACNLMLYFNHLLKSLNLQSKRCTLASVLGFFFLLTLHPREGTISVRSGRFTDTQRTRKKDKTTHSGTHTPIQEDFLVLSRMLMQEIIYIDITCCSHKSHSSSLKFVCSSTT